ncbi:hypothetical protein HDU98_009078 [Podochytrium sp. JEL0797]|nr:hypothetical protein HDU98_009078 [Podochytrium sp. JEL0797]
MNSAIFPATVASRKSLTNSSIQNMARKQVLPLSERREINRAFNNGFLLSFFCGPLFAVVPLCGPDPNNATFRAYYIKGMGYAFMTVSTFYIILTVAVIQSTFSYGPARNGGYANYWDLTYLYWVLLPIELIWLLAGFALFIHGKMVIGRLAEAAESKQNLIAKEDARRATSNASLAAVSTDALSASLEDLATFLEMPKLKKVKEGVPGVMSMGFREMNEKYGVTAVEFMKIEGCRKRVDEDFRTAGI